MTWFTSEYRDVYDQIAAGNGLTPAPLSEAQSLISSASSSQSLLDTAQPSVTPATYSALSASLSSTSGGLSGLESHLTTQVSNFTRYSAATRMSRVVTGGGCDGVFAAMAGALDADLGSISGTLVALDGLVQDVIDGVGGAVAALDAALSSVTSSLTDATDAIALQVASELSELSTAIDTSLALGDTMGMISEFLNNPCARAIVESSGSPELIAALGALG